MDIVPTWQVRKHVWPVHCSSFIRFSQLLRLLHVCAKDFISHLHFWKFAQNDKSFIAAVPVCVFSLETVTWCIFYTHLCCWRIACRTWACTAWTRPRSCWKGPRCRPCQTGICAKVSCAWNDRPVSLAKSGAIPFCTVVFLFLTAKLGTWQSFRKLHNLQSAFCGDTREPSELRFPCCSKNFFPSVTTAACSTRGWPCVCTWSDPKGWRVGSPMLCKSQWFYTLPTENRMSRIRWTLSCTKQNQRNNNKQRVCSDSNLRLVHDRALEQCCSQIFLRILAGRFRQVQFYVVSKSVHNLSERGKVELLTSGGACFSFLSFYTSKDNGVKAHPKGKSHLTWVCAETTLLMTARWDLLWRRFSSSTAKFSALWTSSDVGSAWYVTVFTTLHDKEAQGLSQESKYKGHQIVSVQSHPWQLCW